MIMGQQSNIKTTLEEKYSKQIMLTVLIYYFLSTDVLPACVSTYHVHVWCPGRTAVGIGYHGITDGCEPPFRCWESNSPLEGSWCSQLLSYFSSPRTEILNKEKQQLQYKCREVEKHASVPAEKQVRIQGWQNGSAGKGTCQQAW